MHKLMGEIVEWDKSVETGNKRGKDGAHKQVKANRKERLTAS